MRTTSRFIGLETFSELIIIIIIFGARVPVKTIIAILATFKLMCHWLYWPGCTDMGKI